MALDNKKIVSFLQTKANLEGGGSGATFPDWGWRVKEPE